MTNRHRWNLLFAGLILLVALIGTGCGAAATPPPTPVPPAPTATPVPPPPPTPVPVKPTSPPAAMLDLNAVMSKYISSLPDGFGGIAPAALKDQMAAAKPYLLDVREVSETTTNGYIGGGVIIPIRTLAKNLDKLPAKDQPIVIYCASGHRGSLALETLQLLGYTNVKSLSGGFNAWKAANLPVATGTEPSATAMGKAPDVDKDLFAVLDKYLGSLPDGFSGIAPAALKDQLASAKPTLIDVREVSELTANGMIEGAANVPTRTLLKNMDKLPKDKAAPIVVYCAIGHRGGMAMMTLQLLGYTNVKSLSGGFNAWKAANLPVIPYSAG
jgi:rhodanese-related sulfurtransferase